MCMHIYPQVHFLHFLLCTSFRCPLSFTAFVAGSDGYDLATAIEGNEDNDETNAAGDKFAVQ